MNPRFELRVAAAVTLSIALSFACNGGTSPPSPPAKSGGDPLKQPPDVEVLAGLTYVVDGTPVTLVDGVFESERPAPGAVSRRKVVLDRERVAFGDFFGNAEPDAAAILIESKGGSGSFVHLATVGRRRGVMRNLATALVGDRVRIRTIEIVDGRVRLGLVEHGPEDPLCCPTLETTGSWEIRGGRLVRLP